MTPEIILGPPGTGKTTALIREVEKELERGVPPEAIAYVSFTKKAAKEAVTRAMAKFGLPGYSFPYFRTLHSLCFRSVGISSSEVFDNKQVLEFGRWLGIEVTGKINFEEGSTYGTKPGDRALFMVNLSRVTGIPLREYYLRDTDDLPWALVDRVARGLDAYKKSQGVVDYTDMLEMFLRGNWRPDVSVVIVDEAQDLSHLQWRVVDKLAEGARRLVTAGDDDQAIYRWAGADSSRLVHMRGDVRTLGQSFRVPIEVQRVAASIIKRIGERREKEWAPRDERGVVSRVGKVTNVDWSGDDILVLSRNAYFLNEVEEHIRSMGVVYSKRGNPAVDPEVMGAIEQWEDLRAGKKVPVEEARRIYGYMGTGSMVRKGFKTLLGWQGDVSLDDLLKRGGLLKAPIWHEAFDKMSPHDKIYVLTARKHGEKFKKEPRVRLSTIHGSKGGEADHVVIIPDMAARTLKEAERNPDDEARVWYVAVTRAKRKLTIVEPATTKFFSL